MIRNTRYLNLVFSEMLDPVYHFKNYGVEKPPNFYPHPPRSLDPLIPFKFNPQQPFGFDPI